MYNCRILTVNPEAFQIRTIQTVLSIFDNYHLDTLTREHISPAQREEESRLVDTFLSTDVMSAAMRFLAKKGFVKQDYYEYKALLRQIWFDLFSRGQGRIGSSGFEHVFMAETKQVDSGTDVLGLHNWIFFNAEETRNHVDYLGYIKKVDLGNVSISRQRKLVYCEISNLSYSLIKNPDKCERNFSFCRRDLSSRCMRNSMVTTNRLWLCLSELHPNWRWHFIPSVSTQDQMEIVLYPWEAQSST